jgi:hypothetical protein
MAEASRRAARGTGGGSGRLPNALFVVAAAERPPGELLGIADELSITMPWGSLLDGAVALNAVVAEGIAGLVATGGRVRILVSAIEGDGLGIGRLEDLDADALGARWRGFGLRLVSFRPATADELAASGSSWARRLAAGRTRPAWLIGLENDRRDAR